MRQDFIELICKTNLVDPATSFLAKMNYQQKAALELACNNGNNKERCYVKRELLPLLSETLNKEKLTMSQLGTTLKSALMKHNLNSQSQDCNVIGNVLVNLQKRCELDKLPTWATYLVRNFINNTMDQVRSDWN